MLIAHTVHIFFKATMHVKDRLIECNNYFGRSYMWIINPFPVSPPPPPPPPGQSKNNKTAAILPLIKQPLILI